MTSTPVHQPWPGLIEAYRHRLPVCDTWEPGWEPVTLREGATPLLPAKALSELTGCDVHLKVEGLNPTGSFKDRGMTMAVTEAKATGKKGVLCEQLVGCHVAGLQARGPQGRPYHRVVGVEPVTVPIHRGDRIAKRRPRGRRTVQVATVDGLRQVGAHQEQPRLLPVLPVVGRGILADREQVDTVPPVEVDAAQVVAPFR